MIVKLRWPLTLFFNILALKWHISEHQKCLQSFSIVPRTLNTRTGIDLKSRQNNEYDHNSLSHGKPRQWYFSALTVRSVWAFTSHLHHSRLVKSKRGGLSDSLTKRNGSHSFHDQRHSFNSWPVTTHHDGMFPCRQSTRYDFQPSKLNEKLRCPLNSRVPWVPLFIKKFTETQSFQRHSQCRLMATQLASGWK